MPTRILLVGAGAIGAFYGSRLAKASNVAVSALCRSNYEVVSSSGFRVSSPNFGTGTWKPEFVFSSAQEASRVTREKKLEWAFLVVATKALPDVSDDSALLEGLVGEGTAVVLVQNGLGVEVPYRERFPRVSVLSATTIASCAQPEYGIIRHNRWTRISVGPYLPHLDSAGEGGRSQSQSQGERRKDEDAAASEKNREFVQMLQQGGIEDAIELDHAGLQFARWFKVAINASMNPTCVLSEGCSTKGMAMDEDLSEHMIGVMKEVLAVAPKVLGKPLPDHYPTPEQILQSTRKDDSGSRPSMWTDWEAGKRMELEGILGNPIRMAREKGIAMPRLQTMYAVLKMAQEMRNSSNGSSTEGASGKL